MTRESEHKLDSIKLIPGTDATLRDICEGGWVCHGNRTMMSVEEAWDWSIICKMNIFLFVALDSNFAEETGWVLVASAKSMNLQFGDVSLIGELGTVDSRTRTAHFTEPILHFFDFLRGSLNLSNHSSLSRVLHPAGHS